MLLVEDDRSLASVIEFTLAAAGMEVTCAHDGRDALTAFRAGDVDLVVLDLMLPQVDGFTVCRELRQRSPVPIVILTARDDTSDVVRGLELGADDYMTKPFEAPELLARVRAALRRVAWEDAPRLSTATGLVVDLDAFVARRDGRVLDLSATEFRLLAEFMAHAGQVLTREALLRRVWDYDYLGDSRVVDMAVRRLREKVEDDPSDPRLVVTVRGVGYRFEDA